MKKKLIILAVLLSLPWPAWAGCCGEVAAIGQATTAIVTAITGMQQYIAGVVANAADAAKNAQIGAQGKIADDQFQKQVALRNADAAVKAGQRYQVAPSACEESTRASANLAARKAKDAGAQTLEQQAAARNALTESPAAAAQQGFMDHVKKYCGPSDAALKRCAPTGLPDGDVSAHSFLAGAGLLGKETDYTYSPEQVQAAQAYRNRVVNALPAGNLPPEAEKTAAGRTYLAMRLDEEAKLSLAGKPFADAIAMRKPGLQLGGFVGGIYQKLLQAGAAIPPDIQAAFAKNGLVSPLAYMQSQIDSRTGNPGWYVEVAQASPEAALRELVHISAAQLQMTMILQERLEKIELLQGAQYAEKIKAGEGAAHLAAQQKEALKAIGR